MSVAKAKKSPAVKAAPVDETRLADYKPPVFLVDTVELDFDLGDTLTRVKSRLVVRRNPDSRERKAPLALDGENQQLISVTVDGRTLTAKDYTLSDKQLVIAGVPDTAVVEIESTNNPVKNTALSGLYAAGPMLCTQCEPEGFRRITYYPDRPDVLAKFTVTIHGDKKAFPVLLSNGNLIGQGTEKGDKKTPAKHWVQWQDPFPKPCYLFALVAGDLDCVRDSYTTQQSRREIALEMYVEKGRKGETGFAIDALKKAMRWDEDTYGLEYDLDRFMIVAVSFFNMGAMENKGLNIFNDACVLGRADTATDSDIAFIERVVGHEYFHNWTGDRVTCRDWFQLSLKEGLTVFREQEFCGDMNGRALERIMAVSMLRRAQFAEDAGAMAHSIRPSKYKSIDNFYTSTVYQKGAEVVRMIQTFVGRKGFRKGLNLYLQQNDGQAATCEDFVASLSAANKADLVQFMRWYAQAGTPQLETSGKYDAAKQTYTLTVTQSCPPTPGQDSKKPFHLPLSVGLVLPNGKDAIATRVLDVRKAKEKFVFENIKAAPVASLLREFSAPVKLSSDLSDADLLFLTAHDSDSFNRWEAAQTLSLRHLLANLARKNPQPLSADFIEALRRVLQDEDMVPAVRAMTLTLPSEAEIGLAFRSSGKFIDPQAIFDLRRRTVTEIAEHLRDDLWAMYNQIARDLDDKASDGTARGQRTLKNLCLAYLSRVEVDDAKVTKIAASLVTKSRNMTDKITGLSLLADGNSPQRDEALSWFEKKYAEQPTIMDEWLSAQAAARRTDVLRDVTRLCRHSAFSFKNPNRVSALLGVFCGNPLGFHAADGKGYAFAAKMIAKIDAINPHASSRMAKAFLRWRDYEPRRRALMKEALKTLAGDKKLSVNCREVVEAALK